jgi:F0F1-type ATP synthase assembly protein I
VPAAYMRWRMFQALRLVNEPQQLVGAVYRGQFGKFVLTSVFFALCIARFPQEFLPVISTFVACLLAYIIGGLIFEHDH